MSMPGRDPVTLATAEQRRATSPAQSAWVEANAGTGKTKVLTDRVTRLLLAGVKPERILCLTFTKAAAAEMRNRLAAQLGRWALAEEAALDAEIAKLIDRAPEAEERVIARRLFARVLDAPGGINILTIHAFCQALLKRFPLEAGVAPGFEVLDEGEAGTILKQAQTRGASLVLLSDQPACQPLEARPPESALGRCRQQIAEMFLADVFQFADRVSRQQAGWMLLQEIVECRVQRRTAFSRAQFGLQGV